MKLVGVKNSFKFYRISSIVKKLKSLRGFLNIIEKKWFVVKFCEKLKLYSEILFCVFWNVNVIMRFGDIYNNKVGKI